MASALSASCNAKACQRAAPVRRSAVKAFTAAVPWTAANRQQQHRQLQVRAATENEILDLDQVTLQGPSPATDADNEEQEFSIEDLVEAAESTHYNNMAFADIEAAFLEGSADDETASYLAGLQQEAEELQLEGQGEAAAAALEQLEAAAADLSETVPDAEVVEDLGEVPVSSQRHVLDKLSNDEAVQARQVVAALKLSKEELQGHILPEDWDATTVEWFTNKAEQEIPLPEYKLNFIWMEKNIAVAVDQVYSRGNTSPLTEYFVWPRKDAWEELKLTLERMNWISDRDKIILLNRLTEVINFWTGPPQEVQLNADGTQVLAPRPGIGDARAAFPDCTFAGAM
eukprot:GHRR01001089.1.p1 GENE.GHRR01001089.1~~GHRR01001089.1.p1  ORF type:complete len:343 (+),score=148.46 GHRR01001089.1:153-1181(+)